jgi:hypothetical protein
MKLDQSLYFHSLSYNGYQNSFLNEVYKEADAGGKFFINISKRVNPSRFITRNGEWSLPWNQELIPGFEMPAYDPGFNKTFEEVTDARALEIKKSIQQGNKFAVMYSGGIDSTVIISALIKNLSIEELTSITLCTSTEAVIENPYFWNKFLYGKFNIIDSKTIKYDDLIEQGYIPITADEGDCIFGTLMGLTLYNNFDYYINDLSGPTKSRLQKLKYKIASDDVHYSLYEELIIKHLSIADSPEFGRLLYEKYHWNIQTSSVPVHSLHDFFWWLIFNVKYLNCSVRGALYFNDRVDPKTAIYRIFNWFNGKDYQLWSMANNNNGQKIHKTLSTYKWAAREYIYSLDNNSFYKNFKIKLESLYSIVNKQDISNLNRSNIPSTRIGLTSDFQMLSVHDNEVKNFFKHHLLNYKIDWA